MAPEFALQGNRGADWIARLTDHEEMAEILTPFLFERHSLDEIKEWYCRLRYFRYFRAYGGHANDGDALDLGISYTNEHELLDIFRRVGIEPRIFGDKPEQPIPGRPYSSSEFDCFPSLIPNTQWIAQPGRTMIYDCEGFVWAYRDRVIISAGDGSYDVSEETVACAKRIENTIDLKDIEEKIIDPPEDSPHYVCPSNYPDEFGEQGV